MKTKSKVPALIFQNLFTLSVFFFGIYFQQYEWATNIIIYLLLAITIIGNILYFIFQENIFENKKNMSMLDKTYGSKIYNFFDYFFDIIFVTVFVYFDYRIMFSFFIFLIFMQTLNMLIYKKYLRNSSEDEE